jgi:hypothetical protein
MQPYFFPYVGYFQLVATVDRFVIYDDVNFIKQGWINRNRVLVNGAPMFLSVPLANASSFTPIRCTKIHENYKVWRQKATSTLQTAYGRAPFFLPVFEMVKDVIEEMPPNISALALRSVQSVLRYLKIPTAIVESSAVYGNEHLAGEERVIDICAQEKASHYINMPGGRALYSKAKFLSAGIELQFLNPVVEPYEQFGNPFVPALSIIDVLMFNEPSAARRLVSEGLVE